MSDRYHKPRAGEPMKLSPDMWGDVVDLVRKTKGAGGNKAVPWRPFAGDLGLSIENWKSASLEQFALAHFKEITNKADSDWQLQPLIEFDSLHGPSHRFDAGTVLHAAAARGAANDVIRSYAAGIVPATIYVHDEKHRFVDAPYMGSQTKYWETDWDGPHQIMWKETGTGEKKALLRLGENRPRLLWGRCKEAWRKRGGIPSQTDKWAYVNAELMDYSSGTAGPESDKVVKVLLPTNRDQDPNAWPNMVIGFQKSYQRSEKQTYSGFDSNAWPNYRYAAVTPNYVSSFIGDTKTVLGSLNSNDWALVDGSQDDEKTLSGEAVDASEKFIRYQKKTDQTGGSDTAAFLSAEVISNIAAHPNHTHTQSSAGGIAGEGGENPGTTPGANTGTAGGVGHNPSDPTHEVEFDIVPAWQGAKLYERIDNSAGDEE